MGLKEEPLAQPPSDGQECLLAYREVDGSIRSVGPFARERAEALARAWGQMCPKQTCWVEPLAKEVQDLRLGRVRRRRVPVLGGPRKDH